MKPIIHLLFVIFSVCSLAYGQNDINSYNREEAKCMTLLSQYSNLLFKNDTNMVEFHYNGYRIGQIGLKGDSTVHFITRLGALPKLVPSTDTFQLYIYDIEKDSVVHSETFYSVSKDSMFSFKSNDSIQPYCDYIFAPRIEMTLFRRIENHLFIKSNNYDRNLINIEVENGKIISSNPDDIIIVPGKGRICEIKVFHGKQIILSKQYVVRD